MAIKLIPASDPGRAGHATAEYTQRKFQFDLPQEFGADYTMAPATKVEGIPLRSVVGFDSNNQIVLATLDTTTPADAIKPIGITAYEIKPNDSSDEVHVIRGGHYNANALAWDETFTSMAQKIMAFEGASSPTQILIMDDPD